MDMSEPVQDSIAIAASPEVVWSLISDVPRMPQWSPELKSARWRTPTTTPTVGARFTGTNRNGLRRWSTSCVVSRVEPGREFAFRVTSFGLQVSEWSYTITPTEHGCRLTESTTDHRGVLMKVLGGPATGVTDRAAHNLAGIRDTLAALKTAAEAAAASPSS